MMHDISLPCSLPCYYPEPDESNHKLVPYFFKIYFNMILQYTLNSPNRSPVSWISYRLVLRRRQFLLFH